MPVANSIGQEALEHTYATTRQGVAIIHDPLAYPVANQTKRNTALDDFNGCLSYCSVRNC